MSGFADLTGQPDGPPTLPAFGLADSICGIAASSAALMALRHRDRTGAGQVVDMNILEPIMTAVGPGPTVYQQLGIVEQRHGNRSTNNAPRNTYRTSDGNWVAVSTSAQRDRRAGAAAGGPPRGDRRAVVRHRRTAGPQHVDLLDAYVGDWIAERTRDEVLAAFTEAGAAVAPVYDAQDIVEDPHVRETEMLIEVADADLGPLLHAQRDVADVARPRAGSGSPAGRSAPTPTPCSRELGFDRRRVADLRRAAERVPRDHPPNHVTEAV